MMEDTRYATCATLQLNAVNATVAAATAPTSNSALTRSLSKVKSKLSHKFKSSDHVNHNSYINDQYLSSSDDIHVLKTMKYDNLDDSFDFNSDPFLNSSSLQITPIANENTNHKLPKLSSSPLITTGSRTKNDISLINPQITITSTEEQLILFKNYSDRDLNITIEPVSQNESIVSSTRSSFDFPASLRKNSKDNIKEAEIICETFTPILQCHFNPIITNGLTSPLEVINETDNEQEKIQLESSFTFKKLKTPSLVSSFGSPLVSPLVSPPVSPPMSPKSFKSGFCNLLGMTDLKLKPDPLPEYQLIDYADAMAASILDRVDDLNTNEWKI